MAHEKAPQRRHALDAREAQVAHQAQRLDVVGKQAVQKVRRRDHGEVVDAPPSRIAFERVGRADIESKPLGIDQHLSQRGDVANAEIVALARDRMDAMRGVPHQHQPPVHVTIGMHEAEWIRPARSHRLDGAQEIAEAPRELRLESGGIEGEQALRERRALRPHDRGTVFAVRSVAHRQDGEGTTGQEFLLRHAAMRLLVAGDQHDGGLIVGPGARADSRFFARRAGTAFGRGDQARRDRAAAPETDVGAMQGAIDVDHFLRSDQFDVGAGLEAAQDGGAQHAVLDDPAHGDRRLVRACRLAVIEMQEQRACLAVMAGVRDADVEDRFGIGLDVAPHAQGFEEALAGRRDSRCPAIEGRLGHGGKRCPVDQGDAETALAGGQCQNAAAQAGADHGQIEELVFHAVGKMTGPVRLRQCSQIGHTE